MTPALEIRDLTLAYQSDPVLWDVDMTVPTGSLTAIVGPNGAGKSTLIKAAMELIPRSSGSVRFFGLPLSQARKRIAYVPQRSAVDWDFPITAEGVVLMGLYPRLGWFRLPGSRERDEVKRCLQQVGMSEFAKRPVSDLSGGQQQRIFLARALAQQADLMLMDEPFAAVDAATERDLASLLREIRDQGRTAVVVHHDLESVRELFDRVLLLNVSALAEGATEEVLTPQNLSRAYGIGRQLA